MSRKPGRPRKNSAGVDGQAGKIDGGSNVGASGIAGGIDLRQSAVGSGPQAASASDLTFKPVSLDDAKIGYAQAVGDPSPEAPGLDPGVQTSETSSGPRRGRPPGSRNRIDVSGLEKMLYAFHKTVAMVVPEFELGADEAKQLADTYAECARYYPALELDPKIGAVVNLASAVTVIYGSRVAAVMVRIGSHRQRPAQSQITPMPQPPTSPAMMQEQINGATRIDSPQETPPPEVRTGTIQGVGSIEFPPDHPMFMGRRQ